MHKQIERDEGLKHLSSYVSKLFKRKFGKGPESCSAVEGKGFIIFYIRKFISPMETVLMEQGESNLALHSRNIIMDSLIPDIKQNIEQTLYTEVEQIYHDWNYLHNTGMVIAILSGYNTDDTYPLQSVFEDKINELNKLKNKEPRKIKSIQLDSQIYIVECTGFVLPIEKMLMDKGNKDLLIDMEGIFKNHYVLHKVEFEDIFQKGVEDIFIHWDYQKDQSFMCFILK